MNTDNSGALYVAPIRNVLQNYVLGYDISKKEVTYFNTSESVTDIFSVNFNTVTSALDVDISPASSAYYFPFPTSGAGASEPVTVTALNNSMDPTGGNTAFSPLQYMYTVPVASYLVGGVGYIMVCNKDPSGTSGDISASIDIMLKGSGDNFTDFDVATSASSIYNTEVLIEDASSNSASKVRKFVIGANNGILVNQGDLILLRVNLKDYNQNNPCTVDNPTLNGTLYFRRVGSQDISDLSLNNIVYTVNNQTIDGIKTFLQPIIGDISGNAKYVDISDISASGTYYPTFVDGSGNNRQMFINSFNTLAYKNQNLGIGTNDPSATLDVSGAGNVTGNFTVDINTFFVDASNNRVGIGTTTPSFTLSLGGDIARTIGMNESTLGIAPSLTLKSADTPIGTNHEGGALYLSAGLGTGNAPTSTIIFSNATPEDSGGTRQTLTEKMRITANGKVGIGTTTPSSLLDVRNNDSGYVGAFYNTSATGEGVAIRGGNTSSQNALVVQNYDGNRQILIARSDGNVGIGTSTPSTRLVIGDSAITTDQTQNAETLIIKQASSPPEDRKGGINLISNNALANDIGVPIQWVSSCTGGIGYATAQICGRRENTGDYAGYLQFATSNSFGSIAEKMRIIGNGNVGIGTNNPTYTLDVSGTANITGSANITGNLSVDTNTLFVDASNNRVGVGTTTPACKLSILGATNQISPNNDLLKLEALSGSGASDVGISMWAMATGANVNARNWKLATNFQGHGLFQILRSTSNTGVPDTNAMTINKDGNVGIGTTNPSFTLSLGGDISRTIGMNESTLGIAPSLTLKSADAPSIGTNNEGGALYLSAGLGTGNAPTSTIIFSNATPVSSGGTRQPLTEKMRITGNGNVGIGTTTPETKLVIGDNVLTTSQAQNSEALIIKSASTTPGDRKGGINLVSTNDISADIGVPLQFNSKVNDTNIAYTTASITGRRENSTSGNAAGYLQFTTTNTAGANTEKMRITSAGNVGIGTTTPSSTLDVSGNVSIGRSGNSEMILRNFSKFTLQNEFLDVDIATGGNSWSGILTISNVNTASAVTATYATYSSLGRGSTGLNTSISSLNGPTAGAPFTLSIPSTGVIRIRNDHTLQTFISAQFMGGLGF